MTEKEMYNLINSQNNQQSNGFAVNEKERGIRGVLSAFMRKVYTWITLALLITGVTAYLVASSPTLLKTWMTSRGVLFGLIIAELALVFIITGALQRLSLTTATLLFIVYSVLNGAMLSSVFVVYTMTSIAKVFFITAGTFGAMAFYGYTTKKDLTSLGKILFMALIGLIILLFIVYSVLNGAMLSSVFVVYTMTSIAKVFFITAGTFGAMAFYGYTTKKDLTSLGKILFMALIGLIIATIVNMFLKSSGFDYILSYAGVAIFVGLTAWDSQKIKQMLQTQYDMSEGAQKLA